MAPATFALPPLQSDGVVHTGACLRKVCPAPANRLLTSHKRQEESSIQRQAFKTFNQNNLPESTQPPPLRAYKSKVPFKRSNLQL